MPQLFANGARTRLASAITTGATTITVESATADLLPVANTSNWGAPNNWFKAVLQNDLGQFEIIYVGTRSLGSAVLGSVLRAQDGTAALAFSAGSVLGLRLTAADVQAALGASLNAVQKSGNETIGGIKTFSQPMVGSLQGNADTATHAVTADAAATAATAGEAGYATTAGTPFAQTLLDDPDKPTMRGTLDIDKLPITATTGVTATTAIKGGAYKATGNVTIPANVFAAGDVFSIYNNSAATVTIVQGASLTLRQAGTANTGNRSLLLRGLATVLFISATEAVVSGSGVA